MKERHTEEEFVENNQFQISRLARLYQKDPELFHEVCSFLPFYITISDRKNLDVAIANPVLENWMEKPGEEIVARGFSLIREISDPNVLEQVIKTIDAYDQSDDPDRVCSYLQYMKMCGKFQWILTYKIILNESTFLNTGYQIADLGLPGKFLSELLEETLIQKQGWKRLQSLTKREKEILQLAAAGHSNQEIGERLFISSLTVKTHRRRIMQKLEIKNLAELIRFAHTMEVMDAAGER